MADKKNMVPVRLWDAEGGAHVAEVEYEATDDGSQPLVIEHGGKAYVWNQRNAQYRITEPVRATKAAPEAIVPAQAAEAKSADK